MPEGVSVRQAALEFGVTPQTVNGWLRSGARDAGAQDADSGLVFVDKLRTWRAMHGDRLAAAPYFLQQAELAALDTLKRDGGAGEPLHVSLGIPERKAWALMIAFYERFHHHAVGVELEAWPTALENGFFQLLE